VTHPPGNIGRRSVLSWAVAVGAGAALSSGTFPAAASASVPANSLDALSSTEVALTLIGTEPSAMLRRYSNVFKSIPDPSAVFFRNSSGTLKMVAGCQGLADQVQVFDASTGKKELSSTPFPGGGGGARNVVYEPLSNSILAYGATVKRVGLTGTITNAYSSAPGATDVSFSRASDSKGRIWNGNYPTGNATRYDPSTGATVHSPQVHAGAQYVRSLAVDVKDNVYAGTGVQGPRIVVWHTDTPSELREIALPGAAATGFVNSIAAHSGLLFVHFDGSDGKTFFKVYDLTAAVWRTPPWAWAPAGRVSAALLGSGSIFAVWNTLGTHKLMRIDPVTLAADFICMVPGTPSALSVETVGGETRVNMLCAEGQSYEFVSVGLAGNSVVQSSKIAFAESAYKVQALLGAASGYTMYMGAYMGDGIGSVDLLTRETWRSPTDTGIAQIEGMFEYDASTVYVGSYAGGRLFKFNPQTKSVKSLIELREKYLQSRAFAWVFAGGKVVAGTVAEYGHNTGALVMINPLDDADIKVVSCPVPGQSVLGLVGDGDIVYGTTGIKGGYGSVDDTKPAHIFAWNVRQGRSLWTRAFPGEVEINCPRFIRDRLYVSTNNGVIRVNPNSGSPVFTYKLLNRTAEPGYRTSSISYLPRANSMVHLAGGTVTVLDMESRTRKEILRGNYTDMVITSRGRLYFAENGTNIVDIDPTQKPTISSAADLVTVGTNGWLYVTRSLGGGKFATPIRADSGFATSVRSCHVVDWNGDGVFDVVTNHGDGTLQLHRGLPKGGFAAGMVVGASGWLDRKLAIGKWGTTLSVIASENIGGALKAWPVLSTGVLGPPVTIGAGWKRRQMVMLVPSRSTAAALIVNDAGSLFHYARTSTGDVSTVPVRLSTGGYTDITAMTGVINHESGLNGIVGVDTAGAVKYTEVSAGSVGTPTKYSFLMTNYKFASS
jgi:hypothetical protein